MGNILLKLRKAHILLPIALAIFLIGCNTKTEQSPDTGKWHVGELPDGITLPGFHPDDQLDDPNVDQKLQDQQLIYQNLVKKQGGFDYASSVIWSNYDGHKIKALSVLLNSRKEVTSPSFSILLQRLYTVQIMLKISPEI